MKSFFKTSYGVDLSGEQPVFARCAPHGGRLACEAIKPENPVLFSKDLGPKTLCAAMLQVQHSLTCRLQAPVKSTRKAKMVFPSLLDVQLPFPLENCVFEFTDCIKNPDQSVETIAVAALKKTLETQLASCKAAGCDPEIMDHEGLALWEESLLEMEENGPEYKIMARLRDKGATTLVIGKKRKFINAHSVSHPSFDNSESANAIAAALRAALLSEIPEGTQTQWLFCGKPAENASLITAIHKHIAASYPGKFIVPENPAAFQACALARRALTASATVNLRKNEFRHPKLDSVTWKRRNKTFGVLLIAGTLFCVTAGIWNTILNRYLQQTNSKVRNLAEQLAPESVIQYGQEFFQAEQSVETTTQELSPLFRFVESSLTEHLNNIITEGKHYNIEYTAIVLKKDNLTIAGSAPDWDNCNKLKEKINIPGIQPVLNRRESLADSKIYFTITGQSEYEP